MQKIRVRGLIIENKSIVLIHRIKPDREYYVFPGGGAEKYETVEDALSRECHEELGIKVNVLKEIYRLIEKGDSIQRFYLCTIKEGEIGTGRGPEFSSSEYYNSGQYTPLKVILDKIVELPLFPTEIRDALCRDLLKYRNLKDIPFRQIQEQ